MRERKDGWIYFKVVRGMYGLPQSGSNRHDELETCLNQAGYFKHPLVPALWKHQTRPTQFVLIVDDFGIKYLSTADLDHLTDTLKKYYDVKVDPNGKELVKIELDWDYANKRVHLSMKPYLEKSLPQFDNVIPKKCQHSQHPHVAPKYGSKQQFAEYDESELVGDKERKHIQTVNGKFIWYGRGVDGTILTSLSELRQSKQNQQYKQRNAASNSLTILPPKNRQFSRTARATWYWRSTATPATSMRKKPGVAPAGTIFYLRMSSSPQIMARSTTLPK